MTDAPPTGDGPEDRPSIAEVAAWLRRSAAEQRDREGEGDTTSPLAWPPADLGASNPVGAGVAGLTRPAATPIWTGPNPSAPPGPGEAMNAAAPATAEQDLADDELDGLDDLGDLGDGDVGDQALGNGDVGDGSGDAPTTAPPADPPGHGDDEDADAPSSPPPAGASGLSTEADLPPARSVSQDAEAAPAGAPTRDDEAEPQDRVDPERPYEAGHSDTGEADIGAGEATNLLADAPGQDGEPPEHVGAAPAEDLSETPLTDPPVEVEVRSSGLGQLPDPPETGPGATPDGEDLRDAAPPPAEPAEGPPTDPGSGQHPHTVGGTAAVSLFDLNLVELANRARASARQDLAAGPAEADREGPAASVVGGPAIEAARAEPPAQDESTIAFDLLHDDDLEDDRPLELEATTDTDTRTAGTDTHAADASDRAEGTDEDDQAPVAARRRRPTRTRYPRGQLREPIGILRRIRAMLGVVVVTVVLGIAAGAAFGAILLLLAFAIRNAITSQ